MPRVALVTATDIAVPDVESHRLVAAFESRSVSASIVAWDAAVDWVACELVVIRSPWDYHERLEEFLAWCDRVASVTTLVNPAPLIRWNADKFYLRELADLGVPIVPTRFVPRSGSTDDLAEWFPSADELVVKPAVSIGAIGTRRGRADDEIMRRHLAELVETGDALVQPFVGSVTGAGERSLIFAGTELSHAVCKRPADGDYRVQSHHGGTVHHHEPTGAERSVAAAALEAVAEPCGYARVDLVTTEDGPALMELELIEPVLFLDRDTAATARFVDSFLSFLGGR